MNVKTFAAMVRNNELDENAVKITLCTGPEKDYEVIAEYDRDNPYHISAFGNWKIKSIIAPYENAFELVIETINQIVTI